jgi:hypothetical protein
VTDTLGFSGTVTDDHWHALANAYYRAKGEAPETVYMPDVEKRQQSGMAYVWGWQDRAGETDSTVSLAFGYAYGLHALTYHLEQSCVLRSVGECWERWQDLTDPGRFTEEDFVSYIADGFGRSL